MQYTVLKGTGCKVSRFCLGTMTFGGQTDAETSTKIIDYAFDNGVNFFDTANIYTDGESEKILGQALAGKRDDTVIATKVAGPAYKTAAGKMAPNGSGLGRKYILRSVEDSLKRLQTDYIDVLYMHFPDPSTPLEETVETMTGLVRSGKIRYYGVSNYPTWQLCDLIHIAKENGLVAPVVTETPYNPLTRGADDEMIPFLNAHKVGLAVYNPIAAGLMTGKHERDHAAENTRFSLEGGYRARYWKERNFDAIDELKKIADELGISLLELTFRWHLSNPCIDSVICGVSKYEHAVQNISMFDLPALDKDVLKKFDEVWGMIKGSYYNYHR